ncbi:ATP-binding cassette domain-containing protein [Candidatus Roizmanbacteria bacterium]|jgi:ABC-2 type transport system ATP-binding protein|nr:ATP-binding cassette domain-containing protein [Candidatus Roizmanbacteria bacterium]
MISVNNLSKVYKVHQRRSNLLADIFFRKYKEIVALDKVSFSIGENELVGFIGPNGAGKTTTLKILSGVLYPSSGNVNIWGFYPFDKKPDFLKQIAFIMGQRNQLVWDLPAIDTFKLNQAVYEVPENEFKKTVGELSELLDCRDLVYKPVKTLSMGERMKMELIAALIHQPKIIFLDEPTIGLDIFSQEAVRNFIKRYQQEFKKTIILTSHYLEDVKRLAKRLIVIDKGKILHDGNLKDILAKFSNEKFVSIILEKEIDETELSDIGQLVSYKFPKAVFKVKKNQLAEKISVISKKIPFADLNIEEERIEEVVKKMF